MESEKKNGKAVEGCAQTLKTGGKRAQGNCGGAMAGMFLSPFQQKGGTHLGSLTPFIWKIISC